MSSIKKFGFLFTIDSFSNSCGGDHLVIIANDKKSCIKKMKENYNEDIDNIVKFYTGTLGKFDSMDKRKQYFIKNGSKLFKWLPCETDTMYLNYKKVTVI